MGPEAARPRGPGTRGRLLLGLFGLAAVAWWQLGLSLSDLVPGTGGWSVVRGVFTRAFSPAWVYESGPLPEGSQSLLASVAWQARGTLLFAMGGVSAALLLAIPLGLLASESFWEPFRRGRAWAAAGACLALVRTGIALARSVHELLWAVVFLAAVGLTPLSAVLAIAIPYAGTLAKIFAEMLDEAPRDAADALTGLGATPAQALLLGRLPRSLADMGAYGFYRFECALRSSAVLGFFGFETLGHGIQVAFVNVQYGELWTHLWALIALIAIAELWSGALRRRFVA